MTAVDGTAETALPIYEAHQHIGETKCVTGKVIRVKAGIRGVQYLEFCEDQLACPFTVVVFVPVTLAIA